MTNKVVKLSVVMIAKNESSCLDKCLTSVKGADEIIICDTGSEDNTIEIAKKYTDKVYDDYKWEDSFYKARNHALSKATGDWVLSIDADEELLDTIDQVKKVAQDAEDKGLKTVSVNQISGNNSNKFPRLFKRCPEVYWCGNIHNYLSITAQGDSDLIIKYGYSKAHSKDPDRALRILKKEVDSGGKSREIYYLAREYYYRKDYITAIYWWDEYLAVSKFLAEKADAYLQVARCYWKLSKGETARNYCLQAININANFKEALLLMAEMSWEKSAIQWRKMAEQANSEGVLFVRTTTPQPEQPIELCLVVYQRPDRVPEIIRQLKRQTIQDFNLNIWNNSGKKLEVDFPRVQVIESENIGSQARFRLAEKTKGNPIIFFDDDESLDDNFVEYNYRQYLRFGRKAICGWWTRIFNNDYWNSTSGEYGKQVDYVGTGGMILDRSIIERFPELQSIPEPFNKTEDLYLCYLARKNNIPLVKIDPACKIMIDDKDQYKTIDKEKIFQELRKLGWKLLKDKNSKEMNYQGKRNNIERLGAIKGKLAGLNIKSLLDFGGAEGYFAETLKEYNPVLVEDLRARDIDGVEVIREHMEAEAIKELLKRNFDAVLLLSVIHHFKDYGRIFNLFLDNVKHLFVEAIAMGEPNTTKNNYIAKHLKNLIENQNHELLTETCGFMTSKKRPIYYVSKKEGQFIEGVVERGGGWSKGHMEKNKRLIDEILSIDIFPGSLNVRVGNLVLSNPIQLRVEEYKLPYDFYPCIFNGLNCFIMRPPLSKGNQLAEIVSEVCLRDVFGLKDGDKAKISI